MPWLHLRIKRRPASLRHGTTGNVSVLFAFSLVPMIGLVGLGVDYGMALNAKAKLDNAADAAAISAVATAKAFVAANPNDANVTSDAIAAGKARAATAFSVNAGSLSYVATPTPQINLTSSGQTFSSSVGYQTSSRNNFGRLFGRNAIQVAGSTAASADIPSYVDFYLLLDVSGSMGLPTSEAGQSQLVANTSNSCLFACHFTGNREGYTYSHGPANIKLRVDSVDSAVYQLIQTAKSTQTLTNQYRIGVFPYIADAVQAAPLSSDYTQALKIVSDSTKNPSDPAFFYPLGDNYLDTGVPGQHTDTDGTAIGSGGTHFENIFYDLYKHRSSVGNGVSSTAPKAFVFLVTDGMDNSQNQNNGNWSNSQGLNPNSQPQEPTNMLSYCQYAKNLGIYVSILYIPYIYLNDGGSQSTQANSVSPKLYNDLQQCASTGFMFQANSDADIASAMQAMFAQAIQVAHLLK